MKTYFFRVGVLKFILNVQYSSIGFPYPRVFIAWPDNSYSNVDVTLGAVVTMSEENWFSWFDEELISLDDITKINAIGEKCGIDIQAILDWAFAALEEYGEEPAANS
jgi:hypothetical protein